MSTITLNVTGKKKVLVIACPELAQAIYEALDPLIQPPVKGAIPSAGSSGNDDFTVSWLCERMFPSPIQERQSALTRLWTSFTQFGQTPASTPQSSTDLYDSPMSLFKWGDYDFVIIQDLWPVRSGSTESLECAGYILANLDYYLWGNFSTKKIILVTDETFPLRKAKWIQQRLHLATSVDSLEEVLKAFDEKQAFERVDVTAPDLAKRLAQLLSNETHSELDPNIDDRENDEFADVLRRPVLQEIGKALQTYVSHQAEVLVVDDEFKDLNKTFAQLTGRSLNHQPEPNKVNVVRVSDGLVQQVDDFDQLVRLCEKEFQKSASGNKPYTLLVTDILFGGPKWSKTGLDLIETLRQQATEQDRKRRTGIVAYTAFTTPFIAMSSHQRGADFVVAKRMTGAHDLKIEGSERLLMTLAFLCFQKSFLSNKRAEARALIRDAQSTKSFVHSQAIHRGLRQLQSVLPKYAVSIHLQQEWLDTCYLFEAMNVYGAGSSQLELIQKDVTQKYD